VVGNIISLVVLRILGKVSLELFKSELVLLLGLVLLSVLGKVVGEHDVVLGVVFRVKLG